MAATNPLLDILLIASPLRKFMPIAYHFWVTAAFGRAAVFCYKRSMRKALVLALAAASLAFAADVRPKVRAITAFIRIDAKNYEAQVTGAVTFLNAARAEYQASGFEVETIRVVTQPLAEY